MKKLVSGILIGALLTSGMVFAKQATEKIEVIYDNIKLIIDGKEYQPTDANGNAVEPFAYNGTTYLPLRAVANAFDKEVDWEAQTSTITLGTKNYEWLDQMGFVEYETTGTKTNFAPIEKGQQMTDGIKYDRGIKFTLSDDTYNGAIENNDGTIECYEHISYLLNGNYTSFDGTLACWRSVYSNDIARIKIYGDGELIYTSPAISVGTKSTHINIDVSGVKVMKIYAEVLNSDKSGDAHPCIADARLAKK